MKKEQEQAIKQLKAELKSGQTVYTVLRHTSKSGMCRWFDLYYIEKNTPLRITWEVALATGNTYDQKRQALKVIGCGMDMGYHVVYNLSWALFKKGASLTKRSM